MSDVNSSLPIRTEGDLTEKLQTRILDATNDANKLTVNADGSINITDNGGVITVDATDLDIRDLTSASDSVEVLQATHDNLNANANIQVGNTDVSNANPVPVSDAGGSLTVDAIDLDIRDLVAATDSVSAHLKDGSGNAITSSTAGATRPLDVALRDSAGSLYGPANPLPVSVSVGSVGVEVNDFNVATAVASAASSNHDYTTVSDFRLTQINASGSGKMKIEVQVETAAGSGVFNTVFVQFNSTAAPNMHIELKSPISVVSGAKVRIIRTNNDNQAQNLYSTISGQSL